MLVVLTSIFVDVVSPWGALESWDADTLWAVPLVDVCTSLLSLSSSARRNFIENYFWF